MTADAALSSGLLNVPRADPPRLSRHPSEGNGMHVLLIGGDGQLEGRLRTLFKDRLTAIDTLTSGDARSAPDQCLIAIPVSVLERELPNARLIPGCTAIVALTPDESSADSAEAISAGADDVAALTLDDEHLALRLQIANRAASVVRHTATGRENAQGQGTVDALRRAEEPFARVFRSSPVAVLISDLATGSLIDVNVRFVELFGFAREDVIGWTGFELNLWVDPGLRNEVIGSLISESNEARRAIEGECRLRRRDGTILDVIASVTRIEIDDVPCAVASFVDITRQKHAEAALGRRLQEVQGLHRLRDALQRATSEEEQCEAAVQAIAVVGETTRASLRLVDPEGRLRFVASMGISRPYMAVMEARQATVQWDGDARGLRAEGVTLWAEQPWAQEAMSKEGIGAFATFPIEGGGKKLGLITAYYSEPRTFSEPETEAATTIASTLAFAIEQQRAEKALRESEEHFRTLIADLDVGVLLLGSDSTVLAMNTATTDLLGVTEDAFLGRTMDGIGRSMFQAGFSLINENGRSFEEHERPIARAIASRCAVRNVEMGVRGAPDGQVVWMLVSAEPELLPSGEVKHVICTLVDITDRKRAEEALRASEANYRAVVEGTSDSIFVMDRGDDGEFRAAFLNSSFSRLTGFSPGRVLGKTPAEFMPARYREGALARYRECVAAGTTIEYDESFEREGQTISLITNLTPLLNERGECYRLIGNSRNVTERIRAEQAAAAAEHRLGTVASNLPIIVWAVDAQGRLTRAEGSGLKAFRPVPDESIGDSMMEDFTDMPAIAATISRGLAGESFSDTTQVGEVWLDNHITPLFAPSGEVLSVIGVSIDVTERRRAEEALLQAQKMESLGVLAGGIAHDFNNLLVGVLGNAGLAMAELPPESSAQPIIREIEIAGQRAADLARQMLAYSGKGRFVIQSIDLNALVLEMTTLLRVSINRSAIIRCELAATLPPVEGDATQLRQLVMNLVVNASDALGEAGGAIRVSTGLVHAKRATLNAAYLSPQLRAGEYVFLEVADTGIGMDAETRARIFDPFFTTKFTGRGLGLAAVQGIARGHKGAIRVQSEPGKGATFTLLLPAAAANTPPAPTIAAPAPAWVTAGSVLVVDDEESVRTVTARALKLFGFAPILAADGQEGIDQFRKHQDEIVCVLLDMTMPRMNGEDAFAAIRQIRPDACVILTSGYSEQEATERLAGKGIAGFIQKPYELTSLRDAIRAAIEGQVQ